MYSFPYLEPVCCSMSGSNCCFLTCIQEAGKVALYSHLFKNFSQFVVIHRVKSFGIVNKVDVDVFLELSYLFYNPVFGNLISGSSVFSKTSLSIWKFMVHLLLKLDLTLHSLRHNNIEIRAISNCAVSSKGSSERKSHEALTLNEKPEIIKLCKEGMSKA